jgi:hypothetical protein
MTQSAAPRPRVPPASSPEPRLRELASELWENSEKLVRQEFSLALSELDQRVETAKSGLRTAILGGSVLLAGLLATVAAAILLLAEVMAAWLAAVVVGVAATGAGVVMLRSAKRRLAPDKKTLERTIPNVRQDVRTFQEALK